MKTAILFPKLLKIFFAILEVIVLLGTIIALSLVAVLPRLPGKAWYSLGPVQFVPSAAPLEIKDTAAGDLELRDLQGIVTVTNEFGPGRLAALRWAIPPVILVYSLFFVSLFDLLRRLFRNVARR